MNPTTGKLRQRKLFALAIVSAVVSSFTVIVAGPASAAQEGVRDCGDVRSHVWVHDLGPGPDDQYAGNQWFVYGGIGVQPSCKSAKRWAKKAIPRQIYSGVYRVKIKNGPKGWKCTYRNFNLVVDTTGGLLACNKYKGRKLIGSFSSGPDFATQVPA